LTEPISGRAAALTIAGVTSVGLALRVVLWLRPFIVLDRLFIPDDTYYTLNIARSLAHGHGPTVDGSTLTSGFQPLLGFLAVPFFWLSDSPTFAVRADLALLIVVDTATILLIGWIAHRLAGRLAAIVAASLWAISPVALSMAFGGLETSLAMFLELATVAAWIWANDRPSTLRSVAVGVIAALAVLSRIDAVFLVLALVIVQWWRGSRRALVPRAIACAVTLAPWWGWCIATFGTPVPTSGRPAHALAPAASFSTRTSALAVGAVSGGPFRPNDALRVWFVRHPALATISFWFVVALFVLVALVWARLVGRPRAHRDRGASGPDALAIAASLPVFAAALLVFYAWFAVTYYFTRYLAPVALVAALVVAVGVGRLAASPRRNRRLALGALAVAAVVPAVASLGTDVSYLTVSGRSAPRVGDASYYDTATGYADVARRIVRLPPRGSVLAGVQSGAIGYFGQDRLTVVNLDGVVNPDADAANRHGRIAEYMRSRGVTWIADYQLFVLGLEYQLRRLDPHVNGTLVATFPNDGGRPEYQVVRIDTKIAP
jgi:hypothetical protein